MKSEPVRCWPISLANSAGQLEDGHWITFPEENQGHDLIVCIGCGHLYAVNITKMVYVGPPLNEKLKTLSCSQCGEILCRSGRQYPETFRDSNGVVLAYERPREIPADGQSVVRDFEQLY